MVAEVKDLRDRLHLLQVYLVMQLQQMEVAAEVAEQDILATP
jgi:hypothetical protein